MSSIANQSRQQQPICNKYQKGRCNGNNCKYRHISASEAAREDELLQLEINRLTMNQESNIIINSSTYDDIAPNPEQTTLQVPDPVQIISQPNMPEQLVCDITKLDKKKLVKTFGNILLENERAAKYCFEKKKFKEWLVESLPASFDYIIIIDMFASITKLSKAEAIPHVIKVNSYIPDIVMLFGKAQTNKDWLKELQLRFLDPASYDGISKFTMNNIKPILTFTLVQMFVKSETANLNDTDKLIALYICIMRIISKKNLVLAIDDLDTIEHKYNSKEYEIWSAE